MPARLPEINLLPDESRWGKSARSDPRQTAPVHCQVSYSSHQLHLLPSHRQHGIRESQDSAQQERFDNPSRHFASPPFRLRVIV